MAPRISDDLLPDLTGSPRDTRQLKDPKRFWSFALSIALDKIILYNWDAKNSMVADVTLYDVK